MKSWQQIKELAKKDDWTTVADIAGCSPKNVRMVADSKRPDNFNIQKIFSDLIACREQVARKYKRKPRKS